MIGRAVHPNMVLVNLVIATKLSVPSCQRTTIKYTNGDSDVTLSPKGGTRPVALQNGGSEVPSVSIIAGHEVLGHALENMIGGDTKAFL